MSETRDPEISRLYRDASAEGPPPALGRALSLAAAAAVQAEAPVEVPPRARRKWGAPLALAASVVLGLGIVLRVAVERPDMRPAGQEPAVASAPQMPVTQLPEQSGSKAASGNTTDSVPRAGGAPEPALQRAPRDTRAKAAEVAAATAPEERGAIAAKRNGAAPATQPARPEMAGPPAAQGKASGSTDVAPAAATAPALAIAPPPAAKPAPMAAADPPEPARAARDLGAAVQGAPAPAAAPAKAERLVAGATAGAARLRVEPGAGEAAQRSIAEEKTLLPAEWIKRIIEMRRAGRTEDADASLKRFVERYPDHPVPDAARGS